MFRFYVLGLFAFFVLGWYGFAHAPGAQVEEAPFVMEYRVERVCESPKFLEGRNQHATYFTTELAKVGVRYAGCSTPAPAPVVEELPAIKEEPKLSCPSYTTPLFAEKGALTINTPVGNGGIVTDAVGEWVVQSQDGILLAEEGRRLTVTFPADVRVDSVVIYDNDPKQGEVGWTLNGYALRTTGNQMWAHRFDFSVTTSQLVFDKGDDSPHFNVCISK